MRKRIFVLLFVLVLPLTGCGFVPASVRDGCYRFDDGTPLFKIVGKEGFLLSKGQVKQFKIGGWNDLAQKYLQITPAFLLPGLPEGDPRRGYTELIATIRYSLFAFDAKRNTFMVPIAASGEVEVRLGSPC